MEKAKVLVWLNNQLRVKDNPLLCAAQKISNNIIVIHVLDDFFDFGTQFGIPKMSNLRKSYLYQNLLDFSKNLQNYNINLHAYKGKSEKIISEFCVQNNITHLIYPLEIAPEEIQIQQKVLKALPSSIQSLIVEDGFLIPIEQAPKKIPDNFTKFRFMVEKNIPYTMENIINKKPNKCFIANQNFIYWQNTNHIDFVLQPGENEALKRIQFYWWESNNISKYKETRNGLLGDFSSRLSVYLSLGNVSIQDVYRLNLAYENERGSNESTYWLFIELLWRDFFRHTLLQRGNNMFYKRGFNNNKIPDLQIDEIKFKQWTNAKTDEAFVNAGMQELNATGWLSNRSRQIVASYLINELKVDYRLGAAYFENALIDYDVCSNQGNWLYLSGYGNDPRGRRVFNMKIQQQNYDPNKKYINYWNN
jgi:deoxyribodipyrimidine photo-lyase